MDASVLKRSQAANSLVISGAIILLLLAIFLIQVAVVIDHSGSSPKMSADQIRDQCSKITDEAFRADCLKEATTHGSHH